MNNQEIDIMLPSPPPHTSQSHTLSEIATVLKDLRVRVEKLAQERFSKWTENHDGLLRTWRKQAAINLWLQLASNYYYTRLNDCLSYPSIILSAATSISIFGADNSMAGKFAISIVALISGILTAVNKHLRAAEKSQEFALRAKDYYTFIREIDFILATNVDERSDMGETLERIRSTYDRIVDMQMEPPIHILREYEKKFKPLEASLLTDLQSEVRSMSSQTQSVDNPVPPPTTPFEYSQDPLRPSTRPAAAANSITGYDKHPLTPFINKVPGPLSGSDKSSTVLVKDAQKKIKNSIMSPYQLFAATTKVETTDSANNVQFPQPSIIIPPPRMSFDGAQRVRKHVSGRYDLFSAAMRDPSISPNIKPISFMGKLQHFKTSTLTPQQSGQQLPPPPIIPSFPQQTQSIQQPPAEQAYMVSGFSTQLGTSHDTFQINIPHLDSTKDDVIPESPDEEHGSATARLKH